MNLKKISIFSFLFVSQIAFAQESTNQLTTFGGDPDRFKGDGDLEPPLCNVDIPSSASAPFFIAWSCSDNNSPNDDLRSEVWIKAKGESIPKKVADFFGFPASVQVNQGLLKSLKSVDTTETTSSISTENFSDYLPVEIKLLVRDRGGASAISKVITVKAESSISPITTESSCALSIIKPAVEATNTTTGSASLSAESPSVLITTSDTGAFFSTESFSFSSCDIDEFCTEDLTFNLVPIASDSTSVYSFTLQSGSSTILSSNLNREGTTGAYSGTTVTTDTGTVNISLSCN